MIFNMKDLKDIIQEKLKVSSKTNISKYQYFPKDYEELEKIVYDLIREHGNEANLNNIDTSEITGMERLFEGSDFDGNISNWDVSNVTCMNWMFSHSNFTGKNSNLNKWDVSKVKLMNGMFYYGKFEGNIDDWTPHKDLKYNLIFKASPLEKNPPKWYS